MVNLRRKAWINEKRAEDALIADGWITARMQYSGNMYQKRKDFFGLWDIIALKNKEIKFVQVKTNHKPLLDEFKAFAEEHQGDNMSFEVWVWYDLKYRGSKDRRGWEKISINSHM